ncbi:hypothetical protein MKW98_004019 [Papaver atlanticum]|uniref:FCP1 homology domain-containing protein n=1 Tax=Papaver atlanticum TaxID=357466 RepID=A0AAD4SYX2_9MAGN|nr:hypothetical protein MKW98_004019 [Papaver atlanticum]
MAPSKKANRKAAYVSQITEDVIALQITEDVTKNKKTSHGRRLNHEHVVLALAATSENDEVIPETKKKTRKKKKGESSNPSKDDNPDQKLVEESAQKDTGESCSSPLQNTESMPEMTNRPNSKIEVWVGDHTVDENDTGKKTKTRRKKKKRIESQNDVPDKTPKVEVEKSSVDGMDTDADLTQTISEMKNRPNPEFEVSGHHMTSLQTADQTGVTEDNTGNMIKSKRRRKRRTESQNNDPDETLQVQMEKPLSDGNDTGKTIKTSRKWKTPIDSQEDDSDATPRVRKERSLADVISSSYKKQNHVVPVRTDHEVDRPCTSVKIDTDSMTKSDLPTGNNLVSVEETSSPLEHQKKKKKKKKSLLDSCGTQLLQSKEQSPSLSLEVPKASSKKRKREIKSEKSSTMDVSLGLSSAEDCDSASKRKSKKKKRKEMLLVEVSKSTIEEPQLKQSEDIEVHFPLGVDNPKEGPIVFGEETPAVSVDEHCKEEVIPLLATKSDIKDGLVDEGNTALGRSKKGKCITDVSSCKNAANDSDHAHSNRRKNRKNDTHTTNEDMASESMLICGPPANEVECRDESCVTGEGNLAGNVTPLLGGEHVDAKKIHVSGGENLDVSSNAGLVEEGTGHAVLMGNIPSSPVRTSFSCTRKKLLVLDLNGILVDIVSNVPDGYKADTFIAMKALFKRPFCDDFLKFLFQNFNVGVWSSRTKRNVDSVVDFVMGDMKKNLLFCWDQYHCTDTGYSTLENRRKPLVLKELKKLWNKHDRSLPWEKGAYNESNTILLDDSPYKALRNPPHTAIFPPPYRFEDAGDKSLGPGGDLRVYLEGLLKAEDVQNYVEQHRFGQRAITDKNPSWGFYLRIIGNNVQTRADICSTSNQLQMGSIS